MPSAFSFPKEVIDAYHAGNLAILFGSGLSLGVPGNFPRWSDLPHRLLDEVAKREAWNEAQVARFRDFLGAGRVSMENMLGALHLIKNALGEIGRYRAALTAIFRPNDGRPGDAHEALASLGVRALLTTNYDLLYEAVDPPPDRIAYSWQQAAAAIDDLMGGKKVLFKIHGTAQDESSVIVSDSDYREVASNEQYGRAMSYLLDTCTFLLVGYGMNDPMDLDLVFALKKRSSGGAPPRHFALMRDEPVMQAQRDRWQREMSVTVLPYAEHTDLPGILRSLRDPRAADCP